MAKGDMVYQKLSKSFNGYLNCEALPVERSKFKAKHKDDIVSIIDKYFPSGSGIDNGNKFDFSSKRDKLVINSSFHVMDENGFYCGWIDYTVTVKACLMHGFSIDIKGKFGKRQEIKDILYDLYSYALREIIK